LGHIKGLFKGLVCSLWCEQSLEDRSLWSCIVSIT